MASRYDPHSLSSAAENENGGMLRSNSMLTVEDESNLPPKAIDQDLSRRRESAANFKRLSDIKPKSYRRVVIAEQESSSHEKIIAAKLRRAIHLREKWVYRRNVPEWYNYPEPRHSDYTVFVPPPYHPFQQPLPPSSQHVCQWNDGIVNVFADSSSVIRRRPDFTRPAMKEYADDLAELMAIVNHPECRSFCYRRLILLQERFNMYVTLNEDEEQMSQIRVPHRDFYNGKLSPIFYLLCLEVRYSFLSLTTITFTIIHSEIMTEFE